MCGIQRNFGSKCTDHYKHGASLGSFVRKLTNRNSLVKHAGRRLKVGVGTSLTVLDLSSLFS